MRRIISQSIPKGGVIVGHQNGTVTKTNKTIKQEQHIKRQYTKVARMRGYASDRAMTDDYLRALEKAQNNGKDERVKQKVWRGKPVKTYLNWVEGRHTKELNWGDEHQQAEFKKKLHKKKFALLDFKHEEARQKIENRLDEPFYRNEMESPEDMFNKVINEYMKEFALLAAVKTEVSYRNKNMRLKKDGPINPPDEEAEMKQLAHELTKIAADQEGRVMDELPIIRIYTERALEDISKWKRNRRNKNMNNVERSDMLKNLRLHMMDTLTKVQNILIQEGHALTEENALDAHRKAHRGEKGTVTKIEDDVVDNIKANFRYLGSCTEKQLDIMAEQLAILTPRITKEAHLTMLKSIGEQQRVKKRSTLEKKIFKYVVPSYPETKVKVFPKKIKKKVEKEEPVYEEIEAKEEPKLLDLSSRLARDSQTQHKLDLLEFSTHAAVRLFPNPLDVQDEFNLIPESKTPLVSKLTDSYLETNKRKRNYELFLNILDRMVDHPGGKKFARTTKNIFSDQQFIDMMEAPSNVQDFKLGNITPVLNRVFYPYLIRRYKKPQEKVKSMDSRIYRVRKGDDQHLFKLPKSSVKMFNLTTTGYGNRKTAKARVQIKPGSGEFYFNGKRNLPEYITWRHCRLSILGVLQAVNATASFDVIVKVKGGGQAGQTQAVTLALSRALVRFSQRYTQNLVMLNYLKSDSRQKEKKKAGRPRARKGHQWKRR